MHGGQLGSGAGGTFPVANRRLVWLAYGVGLLTAIIAGVHLTTWLIGVRTEPAVNVVLAGAYIAIFSAVAYFTGRHLSESELALHEAHRRLKATLENMADAYLLVASDWRILEINHRAEPCMVSSGSKYSDAACGRCFRMPSHSVDVTRPCWRQEGMHFEELYAPSGQWFSVSAYPVEYGLAIFYHDITARRTAEDALWTSERRLRTLFSSAGVGIVEVEGDDRFVAVNDRACEILRRSRESLLGMSVNELTWPEDRPLSDTLNGELHAGKRDRVEYDKRDTRGDGTPIWVHVTVSAVRDEDGVWVRSITTIEDISERKRAEEELATARTSAERANRAKDHFLAVLSHELRMPLTPVLMGVSILQDRDDLNGEVRKTLETVRRNVEMEARLIDDLLDLTRIERGKIELQKQRIELRTVIQQAVEVCRPDIEARGLQFGVDFGGPSPYWIDADPARLQQVFWNLLRNAVKFTPQGGRVRVCCRAQGDFVTVEVRDNGIGIDRAALPRLFNAFEQAERCITQHSAAWAWAWRSARLLWKCTADPSRGTVRARAKVPPSASGYHWPRRSARYARAVLLRRRQGGFSTRYASCSSKTMGSPRRC